jgi:hypothetical protein
LAFTTGIAQLVGTHGDRYLGRSKIITLLDKNFWAQIYTTYAFKIGMFGIIILPILLKINFFNQFELTECLYQTIVLFF